MSSTVTTGTAIKMDHTFQAVDPRKQELLEARFLGARVSWTSETSDGLNVVDEKKSQWRKNEDFRRGRKKLCERERVREKRKEGKKTSPKNHRVELHS